MKKNLLIPVALLAICGLAGCNNSGGGGDGKIHIKVLSGYGKGMQTRLEEYSKMFMALNPDISVEVAQIQGSYEGVRKQTTADLNANNDTWGDLVQCYPDHVFTYRMSFNKAVRVDQFIENEDPEIGWSEKHLEDFTNAAKDNLNTGFPFSGRYVLPYSASTEGMYYNPVLLDLTIPGVNGGNRITKEYMNSLTWEELFDNLCPKLVAYNESLPDAQKFYNTSSAKHAVVGYDSDDNAFITLCEQYGFGYTTLDEYGVPHLMFDESEGEYGAKAPELKKLLKKWSDYHSKGYLITKGTNNDTFCSNMLDDNSLLINIGSTGGISYINKKDVLVARLPQAAGHDAKLINQGGSWCILSHNSADDKARQLATWKFYRFICTTEMCTSWCSETGYAPILESVYNTEEWADLIDETDKEDDELLKARNASYTSTVQENLFVNVVFNGSSSSRNYVGGLFKAILAESNPTDAKINELFATAINNIRNDM